MHILIRRPLMSCSGFNLVYVVCGLIAGPVIDRVGGQMPILFRPSSPVFSFVHSVSCAVFRCGL